MRLDGHVISQLVGSVFAPGAELGSVGFKLLGKPQPPWGDSFCDDKCQEPCPASSSGSCPSPACLSHIQLSRSSSRTFSDLPQASAVFGVASTLSQGGLLGPQILSSSSRVDTYCLPPLVLGSDFIQKPCNTLKNHADFHRRISSLLQCQLASQMMVFSR